MSTEPIIARLNQECFCISATSSDIAETMQQSPASALAHSLLMENTPHLFSTAPVFVSHEQLNKVQRIIDAIESLAALPSYQQLVLAHRPAIASLEPGTSGVFFGYDFHLTPEGPRLIEVNTNAGGALLNSTLLPAYRACCSEVELFLQRLNDVDSPGLEQAFVDMFRTEWRALGRAGPLRAIAIVDQNPQDQALYPEFMLFKELFQRAGIEAIVVDPSEFSLQGGRLCARGTEIDLVYNRLTDFYLESPDVAPLRIAYQTGAIALTPHPRAHALLANKRNLITLSSPATLDALGVDPATRQVLLDGVPTTLEVDAASADRMWSERKRYFFKPAAGHGSKAAYRGAKLTKKVWKRIIDSNDYVAQELIPPSERVIERDGERVPLKMDLRVYTYQGKIQLAVARLYRGQTTNMRTPGGGFAAVFTTRV